MRTLPMGLVCTLVLAGCVGAPPQTESQEPVSGAATDPEPASMDAQGCQTVRAYFMVEYRRADPWLPPGFWPADGQGSPAPVTVREGETPALISVTSCTSSIVSPDPFSFGYVGFEVQRPTVSDVSANGDEHHYVVLAYADQPDVRALMASMGWPVVDQALSVALEQGADTQGLQDIYDASLGVADDGGDLASVDGSSGFPADMGPSPLFRIWHASEMGLAHMDITPRVDDVELGIMTSCDIRTGSSIDQVVGDVGCAGGRPLADQTQNQDSRWIASLPESPATMTLNLMPEWSV